MNLLSHVNENKSIVLMVNGIKDHLNYEQLKQYWIQLLVQKGKIE